MESFEITLCSKQDFHYILNHITTYWGSERALALHHPLFIYEFGNSAFVIKHDEIVLAYIFGFIAQTSKTGYIHLVGVNTNYQNKGLGTLLYQHFIAFAKKEGCKKIKAITTPTNTQSINFHKKIGMHLLGDVNEDGIPIVKNYSGPGLDKVVFEMVI